MLASVSSKLKVPAGGFLKVLLCLVQCVVHVTFRRGKAGADRSKCRLVRFHEVGADKGVGRSAGLRAPWDIQAV